MITQVFLMGWLMVVAGTTQAFQHPDTTQVRTADTLTSAAAIRAHLAKSRAMQANYRISDLELRLAVNFTKNSAELTPGVKKQLDLLAEVLTGPEFRSIRIELAGHTCDLGSREYNQDLSEKRVQAAADYLLNNYQIPASQISTRAYGEDLPLIPGAVDEVARQANRRVVVYLQENRAALEKMLHELPAIHGFRWAVFKYSKGGKADLVAYDGSSVLHSNDEYRVFLHTARPKYVYIFQQDSRGNGQWIFPRRDQKLNNPLPANSYYLPSQNTVFALDNTVGTESIYFVVTDQPAEDLEKLLDSNSAPVFAAAMTQTIKVRGLKEVRIGPPVAGAQAAPNVISIQVPVKSAQQSSGDGLQVRELEPQAEVANVMAQYREFFAVLRFEHR